MTAHLLQLAVGPVQEFIAAARRTRDLWFGSWLLSEISKAAAKAVQDHGGNLIFPAPRSATDLEPWSSLTVANIVVAEIHGHQPETIARSAREAAEARWREFADGVHSEVRGALRDDQTWGNQVKDVIEFYSAWVPFTADNYSEQRQRLVRLLAGRKNCRDFQPAHGLPGVPKSSLDGLRETVLSKDRKKWPRRVRQRLRLREGEQLDVVGLVKRQALGKQSYPSVSRVAADPWIRGIVAKGGIEVLTELVAVCDGSARDLLNRLDLSRLASDYELFPFEGSGLYRQRHHELLEETSSDDDRSEREEQLKLLCGALGKVERFACQAGLGSEPDPYVGILVADGDRMGAAISALKSPNQHRNFSAELSTFALQATDVFRNHHGVLIYSGGDDVLGFLPVDRALACARSLHTLFHETMKKAVPHLPEAELPTLSVGIAIGHFLENLEDLLAYGRAAEKHAKSTDRDGLAVHLHKRGGAPIKVRTQWPKKLDGRLTEAAGWFRDRAVSNRTPYELNRLADTYEEWPAATLARVLRADAARVIDRKRPSGTDDQMQQIRAALEERVNTTDDLRELAAELLIARQFAVALKQSGGRPQ